MGSALFFTKAVKNIVVANVTQNTFWKQSEQSFWLPQAFRRDGQLSLDVVGHYKNGRLSAIPLPITRACIRGWRGE